ncbi:PHD finger protein 10 [Trachymyrmex cornetzi]|uniref:PHD finger protein 10 n=1 Tax=Trachymyrmex cornetzi TaxID=471704 RepID=A0A195DX06_9HYME|nr:PHD finger protein 10 [Trachymyrmex cornetzi]
MSDGSKMGLFGSKDRNQEQKEKSSKDNSPSRYAPYGVDSDTETYDTEALSMMDINDIIGVQSGEQIGDSTLESEIAALSQIITESKIEPTLQLESLKPVMQRSSTIQSPTSSTVCITSTDNIDFPNTESSIVSEKCTDSIHELQQGMSDLACKISPDKVGDTSTVCTAESVCTSSSNNKSHTEINTSTVTSNDDTVLETATEKSVVEKTEDETVDKTIDSQNETKSGTRPMVTVGNISKSLQLIGEAYNSEDSEETDVSDLPKETTSLSVSIETSLPDVSPKQYEKDNSVVTDILEPTTETSSKLNNTADVTISEELNVKVENVDSKIEDPNIKESEDSNCSKTSQVLEIQENTDEVSNKVECIENDVSSHIQSKNNTEIEVDITEGTVLEHQFSNEISKETIDLFINTSTVSTMELTESIDKNKENTEIESSISVTETEKQDNSTTFSEKETPNTGKINDNCPIIDDAKECTKDVLDCEDRDVSVSATEFQESTLTEMSDKELNIIEVTNKNNNSQEADVINEICQTTHEDISVTTKINDDSQETTFKQEIEGTATTSNTQSNVDVVNAEETSVPMDRNTLQTASDTANKELILNEDISTNHPDIEEKNVTANTQPTDSNLLSEENSDLCSKNLTIQNDSTNINDSEETNVCMQEDVLGQTGEILTPVEHDESVKQFPSMSDKSEIDDTASNKFEELHSVPISCDNSSNITENINKFKVEETEDVERKTSEAISFSKEDETSMKNKSEKTLDQPESCIQKEVSSSVQIETKLTSENVISANVLLENDTNSSLTENLIVSEDDVTDYVCNKIQKEDKVMKNITEISLNETAIKVSELNEEVIKEIEKEKSHKINSDLESVISEVDIQTNQKDINLHDDGDKKPSEKPVKISVESKESIDDNVTPIIEENVKSVEESTDANLKEVQSNVIDISLLHESSNENLNAEKSTEKLSQDSESIDTPATAQTIDTLEGLLDITLMSDNENSSLKDMKTEDKVLMEEIVNKNIDMDLLLDQANQSEATMTQNSDYITNVIASCLTNRDNEMSEANINITSNDKTTENEDSSLKMNEDMSTVSETADNEKIIEESLGTDSNLQQNDLDMDFESNRLESVDLEESEAKLELSQDILLEGVSENLSQHADTPIVIENSQSSSEISELESAVKFLQESEEQTIDSLVLSPKMVESVVEDITKQANAELYVSDEMDNYENAESELEHLKDTADAISISEAEIISEAAKLENERKFATQMQNVPSIIVKDTEGEINETEACTYSKTSSDTASVADSSLNAQIVTRVKQLHEGKETVTIQSLLTEGIPESELIPGMSILEERLMEPPKIEIPILDSAKVLESSISPNDNLLIPKDARTIAYSRMLESPKSIDKIESKGADTPRKDSEKHSDFENVGSPRIILKIAKSAITDCSEPRSPKSPKIRSATNSPNPDDSPGQKLGKIKLKLSKGGHPSIISNENLDEVNQWHTTDNTSSLSPIGMKIKLSKSGDASIVGTEKHESLDDSKETKYKIEEPKRTDSPIGMKIKLSKSGDASIISDSRQQDIKESLTKHKEKLEIPQGSPKRTESPIGMKIKLSKTGDASIIQTDRQESLEEHKEITQKRTDSPIGMKIKLSKTGDASIVSPDTPEDSTKVKEKQDYSELPKRTESPIGMKIKLSKCKGGASIISVDNTEDTRDKLEVPDPPKRTESPLGMKIKLSKTGDASIIHSEITEDVKEIKYKDKSEISQDTVKTSESSGIKIKVKTVEATSSGSPDVTEEQEIFQASESSTGGIPRIKVSKSGDTSIVSNKTESTEDSRSRESQAEASKRTESPLGMKIKLSKSGDASIVQSETIAEEHQSKITRVSDTEYSKGGDSSLGMKIKLFKSGDASVVETPSSSSEKKDKQQRRRDTAESPLEMKIKLSKTGHPTIVACDNHGESSTPKGKDPAALDPAMNFSHRYMEHAAAHKEPALKILKTSGHHSSILQSNRSELTIEPVQVQSRKQPAENAQQQIEISPKRKDVTISPVESKKSKLETQLSQILPEVTIQPVLCRDQKQQQQQQQLLFDPKTSLISRQQMNVINQEISITQVRPDSASDKFKDTCKNSPGGLSDCEIIEHRPELIIVNENSNSSQDVVIIEEVTPNRIADIKVPKKRGRPRRNPAAQVQQSPQMLMPKDPLALDEMQQVPAQQFEHRENERPKRTCRNQKSYAPPKRGRGRGRGKRKLDNMEPQVGKKARVDQDLDAIEASTMAVITIDETPVQQESLRKSSEQLYKALKQPPVDRKSISSTLSRKEAGKKDCKASEITTLDPARLSDVQEDAKKASTSQGPLVSKADEQPKKPTLEIVSEKTQKSAVKQHAENKGKMSDGIKEIPVPPGHSNWLTPTSKKQADSTAIRGETVSTVQVIDEETRMSAESGSRSQTPARNIPAPTSETIINEESQGSVLSTATTESEKVKVKNRRMEINFDPDEGPFTVDKIAEYEWPLDRKGETFMIQEQISQYLGVKSFKRKYPDLKRRVVDMEERNYLRENGLVSEAMCDMGLTAICSSEVLDVMCSDFPDQYEEYRKHMREKQVKEHSKKQKELTAAANAERNRIDLAEMAMQSAFTWNANLNKARKEQRKYCLDLQTFTIHQPQKQHKTDSEHKVGHYPVALIPGQYTDYYREYTPAELRYYPLNTVLYGPTRPNERKSDSQSEGSQSDSDSESSSDDSSSSSSEGTQDTEGSQSTMDEVDMEISNSKDDTKLKCKMCLKVLNKHNKNEILIQCGTCNGNVHPSCIDLTLDMVPHIQSYAWQCTDCKTCVQCHDPADEDKMLFCDMCDRGYHIYCVGLRRVPQGRWHCQECAVCANCGSREAGGANSDRNSVAQWQHEYKKGEKNTRIYVSTLCVPCSKLWRKGRYCPHCSRCHTAQRLDLEANLVHCSACDKYLHLECVETKGVVVDKKNYQCDFCTPSTSQHVKPLLSKVLKT